MEQFFEDVLKTIRFESCLYFKHDFCGAWGMSVPKGEFAQFHFVVGGRCVVYVDQQQYFLERGDLVIFPTGKSHQIKAEAGANCVPGKEWVDRILSGNLPKHEEEQASTHLVCGHYELDRELHHFLIDELPDHLVIKHHEYGRFDLIYTVLELIIEEWRQQQLGYKMICNRFAEILFISILRHYYLIQFQEGKINLLRDEAIYQAVNLIHQNIDDKLTIDKLAKQVGLSRTLFIERFNKACGITPLQYIKHWRMTKAKSLLQYSDLSLMEIAERVGYASASSFNRVFTGTFEVSPRRFRLKAKEKIEVG